MNEESNLIFRGEKCAGIIKSISELYNVSIEKATDIYYESDMSNLIEEGVADLHCRSNKYLASLVWDEYSDTDK